MTPKPIYIIASNSIDASRTDFSQWVKPAEARRMSLLLKRAVASTATVVEEADTNPDTVIVATGYGCWSNTEKILRAMAEDASAAMPTAFMQSTHNTIASLLAIRNSWHGYNSTVSNGALSFECALMEAWVRMQAGKSSNVLLGACDEVTDCLSESMTTDFGSQKEFTPVSTAFLLSDNNIGEKAKVVIEDILADSMDNYQQLMQALRSRNIDCIVDVPALPSFSLVNGAVALYDFVKDASASGNRCALVNASSINVMAVILKVL